MSATEVAVIVLASGIVGGIVCGAAYLYLKRSYKGVGE